VVKRLFALWLSSLLWCSNAVAAPAPFPGKPVRIVLGFAPAGAVDTVIRAIAQAMGQDLGQPVIVDNKPGAEGIIAAQEVQRSAPDGYTLLVGSPTALVAVPLTRAKPPYDPFKDFTPIGLAGQFALVLVVADNVPAKNVDELLAHVSAHPGELNVAVSSATSELAMHQLLGSRRVVGVRFKGDVPALTELAGQRVQMMWATGGSAQAFLKDGRVRALLTLQAQRSPLWPTVPTALEAGLGPIGVAPWIGLFGPAGMPTEVVDKLNRALEAALASSEVRQKLAAQAFDATSMTPAQFSAYFRRQYDDFNRVVREHGLSLDP